MISFQLFAIFSEKYHFKTLFLFFFFKILSLAFTNLRWAFWSRICKICHQSRNGFAWLLWWVARDPIVSLHPQLDRHHPRLFGRTECHDPIYLVCLVLTHWPTPCQTGCHFDPRSRAPGRMLHCDLKQPPKRPRDCPMYCRSTLRTELIASREKCWPRRWIILGRFGSFLTALFLPSSWESEKRVLFSWVSMRSGLPASRLAWLFGKSAERLCDGLSPSTFFCIPMQSTFCSLSNPTASLATGPNGSTRTSWNLSWVSSSGPEPPFVSSAPSVVAPDEDDADILLPRARLTEKSQKLRWSNF